MRPIQLILVYWLFFSCCHHTLLRKPVASPGEIEVSIPGLQWQCGAFRNTRMNYHVWIKILGYILNDNALSLSLAHPAPGISAQERLEITNPEQPEQSEISDEEQLRQQEILKQERLKQQEILDQEQLEQLEQLATPLRRLESRAWIPSQLFTQNYQRRFEIARLLDATLNADQVAVERFLEGKDDSAIKAMLSTSGTAVITHLGIQRTGTPLQMALYSHDEALFKLLADQMDPAEVVRQCKVIFDRYEVADYNRLMKKLKADANKLCSKFKSKSKVVSEVISEVISEASATDITNALRRVPGTTSALQEVLNRFNIKLNRYVRDNPVHNPYILQCLFEIYNNLPFNENIECLLSQQSIGLAQKLSSTQWLQHYAQGIYNLTKESIPETPRRQFSSCGSAPALDIHSSAFFSRLGVNSCIELSGWPSDNLAPPLLASGPWKLSNLLSSKNSRLSEHYAASLSAAARLAAV